jgi:hypothetical protein
MRETRDQIMDGASVALCRRDGRHLGTTNTFFQICIGVRMQATQTCWPNENNYPGRMEMITDSNKILLRCN